METIYREKELTITGFYENNREKFYGEFIILDSPLNNKLSRFSYLFGDFEEKVVLKDRELTHNGEKIDKDEMELLRELLKNKKPFNYKKMDFFTGGFVGLVSYDYKSYIEKIDDLALDDLKLPDMLFVLPNLIVIKDEWSGEFFLIDEKKDIREWNFDKNEDDLNIDENMDSDDLKLFNSNISKDYFEEIVDRAKEYIKSGDIFQVNLSQRFESSIDEGESFLLYKILRKINPSPFASYVNLKEFKLISQSPERLISLNDSVVESRPIAGTRRRKDGEEEKLEKELILNEKERAEHIMLVDLERNDIGRVCEYGSVKVDEFMVIEKYSHVMHIVSNVVGKLYKKYDAFDLIKAVFPGGTITGAPKVRTMEIIEELETTKRGFYTGSIGYIGFDGNMDFNIIIRSFVEKDLKLYFQVGAGVVYDSIPYREYRETINKGRAMILAYKNLILRR